MFRFCSKKTAARLAVALALLTILSGCGATGNGGSTGKPKTNNFAAADDFQAKGTLEFLRIEAGAEGFPGASGYYLTNQQNETSYLLYFIDYASAQKTVVCSRPECTHSDESCTAWMPYASGGMLPVPVGDKLVFLYGGSVGIGSGTDSAGARLEVMKQNGADRRAVYSFASGSSIQRGLGDRRNGFARDEANLYFFVQQAQETESGVVQSQLLCAYNAESNQMFLLKEMDVTARLIGAFEDKLVLETCPGGQSLEADFSAIQCPIILFSLTDGSETQIGTHPALSDVQCQGGDLYSLSAQGQVEAMDLHTGQSQIIAEQIVSEEERENGVFFKVIWQDRLFFSLYKTPEETGGTGAASVYPDHLNRTLDGRTGEVWQVPFTYETENGKMTMEIAAETQEEYLLITGSSSLSAPVSLSKGDASSGAPGRNATREYSYYTYGMIPKEDFWKGVKERIRPVRDVF